MLLHRQLNVALGDEGSLRWKAGSGASDAALLRYLAWAEVEYLGLKRFDVERARRVVGELRALRTA